MAATHRNYHASDHGLSFGLSAELRFVNQTAGVVRLQQSPAGLAAKICLDLQHDPQRK